MDKSFLKNIIADQRESVTAKLSSENIISRDGLVTAMGYLKHPNILLISGPRRAGKSIFAHILAKGIKYTHLNFDDERLTGFKTADFNNLLECFYELYPGFEVMILDEIQNIKGWELFVSRLRDKYKVIVTGSNANLLSSELATRLTGRFLTHTVFPLSFNEFLRFKGWTPKPNWEHSTEQRALTHGLFSQYMTGGGIFDYYKFGKEFLRQLFSSVITKDVVLRYGIRHPTIFEEFGLLAVNYYNCKISYNKISKALQIRSPNTTRQYLKYLENAFLVFSINRFSYKVREQLSTLKKIYVIDNGFIQSLSLNPSEDKGKLLENIVAVELKRRGRLEDFELFYWDEPGYECDFVIRKAKKFILACQVCFELNLNNRNREIAGLNGALNYFGLKNGLLLTDNQEEIIKENGLTINIIPAWKWLLQREIGRH